MSIYKVLKHVSSDAGQQRRPNLELNLRRQRRQPKAVFFSVPIVPAYFAFEGSCTRDPKTRVLKTRVLKYTSLRRREP